MKYGKVILLVLLIVLMAGCGKYIPAGEIGRTISGIEISVSDDPVEVGDTAQVWLSVLLANGDIVEGVTTSYTDQESGEFYLVSWDTDDDNVAVVDSEARLIPRTEGFVTVTAMLSDVEHSRVVRVDYTGLLPAVVTPPPDDDTTDDNTNGQVDPPPVDPPPPVPCQGHAVDVVSFVPGSGAGFGYQDFPDIVLGPPEGAGDAMGGADVLSLGRLGWIVLDLGDCNVVDGPDEDLIVFENPFFISGDPTNPFAELGVVGVSNDGVNFVEFNCSDAAYPYTGCAGWTPVYSATSNTISPFDIATAGGDAFDLADVGMDSARYVKIRDVSDYGGGTTAGFDLDAVSVVNGEM